MTLTSIRRTTVCLFLCLFFVSNVIGQEEAKEKETEAQKLFNGTSLEGWAGDESLWSVKDGVIVGQTSAENPIKNNSFLIWQGGEVADFELRFNYKMNGGNSGVQIRSKVVEGFRVHGYQADFDAGNAYTGIWYDEGGRGILVKRCKQTTIDAEGKRIETDGDVKEEDYVAGLKADDWNAVVVTAKGNRLTHSINGKVSAVLIDDQKDQAEATGIIALQIHQGPPMTIMFKDIELTVIKE